MLRVHAVMTNSVWYLPMILAAAEAMAPPVPVFAATMAVVRIVRNFAISNASKGLEPARLMEEK